MKRRLAQPPGEIIPVSPMAHLQISKGALDRRRRCEQWAFRFDPLTQGREQWAGKCFAFVGVNSAVGVAGVAVGIVQLADETNADKRARSVELERRRRPR